MQQYLSKFAIQNLRSKVKFIVAFSGKNSVMILAPVYGRISICGTSVHFSIVVPRSRSHMLFKESLCHGSSTFL